MSIIRTVPMNAVTADELVNTGGLLNEKQAETFMTALFQAIKEDQATWGFLEWAYHGQTFSDKLYSYAHTLASRMFRKVTPWFDVFAKELGFTFDDEVIEFEEAIDQPVMGRHYEAKTLSLWLEFDPNTFLTHVFLADQERCGWIYSEKNSFEDLPTVLALLKEKIKEYDLG